MRKRLVRVAVFVAVTVGVAVGATNAAGALSSEDGLQRGVVTSDGTHWE